MRKFTGAISTRDSTTVFYWICFSKLGTKINVAMRNFKYKLGGGKFYEFLWYDKKTQIISALGLTLQNQ